MKVITKAQANRIITESLFTPGGTLVGIEPERVDLGKYKKTVIGRDVPDRLGYVLVWAESRRDSYGTYYILRGIKR